MINGSKTRTELYFLLIAASLLSITAIWFVESWIALVFFIMELLLICLVYFTIFSPSFSGTFNSARKKSSDEPKIRSIKFHAYRFFSKDSQSDEEDVENNSFEYSYYDINYDTPWIPSIDVARLGTFLLNIIIVTSPIIVLLCYLFNLQNPLLISILGLLTTTLIPGYAFLKLFNIEYRVSLIECVILSYIVSYIFTGLTWFIFLPLDSYSRPIGFLIVTILLTTFSYTTDTTQIQKKTRPTSISNRLDAFILGLVLSFFIFDFIILYPEFAFLTGTDLSRHYSSSLVLGRNPDLYTGFVYLFAHLHQSAYLYVTKISLAFSQQALVFLCLFLPLTFYAMAKRLCEKVDSRIPILGLVMWALFTHVYGGLSWIVFAIVKVLYPHLTQLQVIGYSSVPTYNSTIYALIGLWYVPQTIAIVILMIILMISKMEDLSSKEYIGLFSLIFTSLYLTHVAEAVFIAGLFSLASLIFYKNQRIKESLIGCSLGFAFIVGVYTILSIYLERFSISSSLLLSILLPILLVTSAQIINFLRKKVDFSHVFFKGTKLQNGLIAIILSVIVYGYFLAWTVWLVNPFQFQTSQVNSLGIVPWYIFPLILGITGFLGVISAFYLALDKKEDFMKYGFIFLFVVVAFAAGRLVSVVTVYLFPVGFWEKRFLLLIKIPLALIAPYVVVRAFDGLSNKIEMTNGLSLLDGLKRNSLKATSVLLVGLIIVSGFSTSLINVEYWYYVSNDSSFHPSDYEFEGIEALRSYFDQDIDSWLLTLSPSSGGKCAFAGPTNQLSLRSLITTSSTPDMVLRTLYRHPSYSHPYLFITPDDYNLLQENQGSIFDEYLDTQEIVFENPEASIYNLSAVAPPKISSNTALVSRLDGLVNTADLLQYLLMSESGVDYSSYHEFDSNLPDTDNLVLTFDPSQDVLSGRNYQLTQQSFAEWDTIEGNWSYADGVILGGIDSIPGIITGPIFSSDFNANFSLEINSIDNTIQNYFGFIHSYVDELHYEITAFLFHSTGYIYLLNKHVNGIPWSTTPSVPDWPGSNTGITWNQGDMLNIRILLKGESTDVFVNNSHVFSSYSANSKGKVGFFYHRLSSGTISNCVFYSNYTKPQQPIDFYKDLLLNGKTIYIINTDGPGGFYNESLVSTGSVLDATRLEGPNLSSNFASMQIPFAYPVDSDVIVRVNYYDEYGGSSPCVFEKIYGSGILVYLNLYPLLQFYESLLNPEMFEILKSVISNEGLPLVERDVLTQNGYFESLAAFNATCYSDTITAYEEDMNCSIVFSHANNQYVIEDLSFLSLTGSNLAASSSSMYLQPGAGPYSIFITDSISSVSSESGITLTFQNNDGFSSYDGLEYVEIHPNHPIELLYRSPRVISDACTFTKMYSENDLYWKTGVYGQSLLIDGPSDFTIGISDFYSQLVNISFSGDWSIDPPLTSYDMFSVAIGNWVLIVITLPALFIMVIVSYRRFSRDD